MHMNEQRNGWAPADPGNDRVGRRIRMLDVADSLGVSRATVSLVMRDSPLVAVTTKAAVLHEADRLGYVYNRGAANLRTQRSDVIGLVMPDIVNPFVGEVSLGSQDVLDEYGFFVIIANTRDRLDAQRHIVRSWSSSGLPACSPSRCSTPMPSPRPSWSGHAFRWCC